MFGKSRMASPASWLALGLVGGAVAIAFWPHSPLHAVSTDRTDPFIMATGFCDDGVEAVWFLDRVTGDLRAVALSKQSGTFNAFFKRNIFADLNADPSKNPRFTMVTGEADLRRSGGARTSPSRSILYVAEVTSGVVAAYSIPWSSSAWTSGQRLGGEIVLLDKTLFSSPGLHPSGPTPVGKEKR